MSEALARGCRHNKGQKRPFSIEKPVNEEEVSEAFAVNGQK